MYTFIQLGGVLLISDVHRCFEGRVLKQLLLLAGGRVVGYPIMSLIGKKYPEYQGEGGFHSLIHVKEGCAMTPPPHPTMCLLISFIRLLLPV